MQAYRIGTSTVKAEDEALQSLLQSTHSAKLRPVCLCRNPPVEMYVAKIAGHFYVKRMPNSGSDHAASCESYEPPAELSGLGEVMGSAIQEDPESSQVTLKFDFSLSKFGNRAAPVPSDDEADSAKSDGTKLSLRGLLHYLWEQAGFNKWTPAMHSKRSWYVIRKYVLQAADDKTSKGGGLRELLYMPESFNIEHKNEIAARRLQAFGKLNQTLDKTGKRRQLMVVVGEVKEIGQSRYTHKIVFKNAADCHFMIKDDLHKQLKKRFAMELAMWDAQEDTRLIAIGTFGVNATGVATIEEVALMAVTEQWIPYENILDKMLIDSMTQAGRRFIKGMRYNLAKTRPLASLVASDTQPPTAMYIIPSEAQEDYTTAIDALIAESKLASWVWRQDAGSIPALPSLK